MKHKLKGLNTAADGGLLIPNPTYMPFTANQTGSETAPKSFTKNRIEEFMLSEFGIDQETLQEHFEELKLYMLHNELPHKLQQD